jgi:hypothetical protein
MGISLTIDRFVGCTSFPMNIALHETCETPTP